MFEYISLVWEQYVNFMRINEMWVSIITAYIILYGLATLLIIEAYYKQKKNK